jgi:hypothetical protein
MRGVILRTGSFGANSYQVSSSNSLFLLDRSARELVHRTGIPPIVQRNSIHFEISAFQERIPSMMRASVRLNEHAFIAVLRQVSDLIVDGLCDGATDLIFCESPIRSQIDDQYTTR